MSGFDWVPCYNFNVPQNAVKGGYDLDGSEIFIGQTCFQDDVLPCKIIPRRREAYVCYDGHERKVSDFKVLCQKTMHWVSSSSNGLVPYGAVSGGRTSTGEILYVGRTTVNGATVVGKVHPSHRCLYVPFDGKEIAHREYEVLVLN